MTETMKKTLKVSAIALVSITFGSACAPVEKQKQVEEGVQKPSPPRIKPPRTMPPKEEKEATPRLPRMAMIQVAQPGLRTFVALQGNKLAIDKHQLIEPMTRKRLYAFHPGSRILATAVGQSTMVLVQYQEQISLYRLNGESATVLHSFNIGQEPVPGTIFFVQHSLYLRTTQSSEQLLWHNVGQTLPKPQMASMIQPAAAQTVCDASGTICYATDAGRLWQMEQAKVDRWKTIANFPMTAQAKAVRVPLSWEYDAIPHPLAVLDEDEQLHVRCRGKWRSPMKADKGGWQDVVWIADQRGQWWLFLLDRMGRLSILTNDGPQLLATQRIPPDAFATRLGVWKPSQIALFTNNGVWSSRSFRSTSLPSTARTPICQ